MFIINLSFWNNASSFEDFTHPVKTDKVTINKYMPELCRAAGGGGSGCLRESLQTSVHYSDQISCSARWGGATKNNNLSVNINLAFFPNNSYIDCLEKLHVINGKQYIYASV